MGEQIPTGNGSGWWSRMEAEGRNSTVAEKLRCGQHQDRRAPYSVLLNRAAARLWANGEMTEEVPLCWEPSRRNLSDLTGHLDERSLPPSTEASLEA